MEELYADTQCPDCKFSVHKDKCYDHDVPCMHIPENYNSVVKVFTYCGCAFYEGQKILHDL